MPPQRRTGDAIRAVDNLVHSHLQQAPVDVRVLVNLAVAMATEYSGAARGSLLVDEGAGLVPRFAVGPGLVHAVEDETCYDAELVAQAADAQAPAQRGQALATPVMLGGKVRGVLFLEAGMHDLEDDAGELASAVASRIATLLHSARLVAVAAQRAKSVETLEALSDCLSAGALHDEHLARAIDAVLSATRSDDALLILLDAYGMPVGSHLMGRDRAALAALAAPLASAISAGDAATVQRILGDPHMIEALRADLIAGGSGPQGILAVRRRRLAPYGDAERSFFRALANLLAGALARLAYFRRASEDPLTGTGSRLALELAFEQAVERARRDAQSLSVMLIDVDHFKRINDTHGHPSGDKVLGEVAAILRSRLRARDFVARYGGDEFLILLPDTQVDEAAHVAEALRDTVAGTKFGDQGLTVSLSIGLTAFPRAGDDPRSLLAAVDHALYDAKRSGRNRVAIT